MTNGMTILHLSDLHFKGKDKADQKIVIDALIKDIERQVNVEKTKIDLVIFSGDLVQAGAVASLFDEVKTEFVDRVVTAAKISSEEFVVCPGNHDIDASVVDAEPYIETGLFHELRSKGAINSFLDGDSPEACPIVPVTPIKRLTNFYAKVWNHKSSKCVLMTPFVVAYRFEIAGKSVGACCFNSAWRTTGKPNDVDYGHLIVGERTVDAGVKAIANADIRVAVVHHPIPWLSDADQAVVEGRIQTEFDLLLCGHIHRAAPEQRKTVFGEVVVSQGSCLYHSREYFNGYNIVRVLPETAAIEIAVREYSDTRREFIPATRVLADPVLKFGLAPRKGREASSLAVVLLKSKPVIRSLANSHISLVGASGDQLNIETHFECPELVSGSIVFSSSAPKGTPTEQIATLLKHEKSVVIVGRSESGKTSLAHYLAVRAANGHADQARLPLIGKFGDLRKGDHPLWRLFRNYANEISDSTITRAVVEKEKVLAILDDVDLFDADGLKMLSDMMAKHANVRWIFLVNNPAASISLQPVIEKNFPGVEVATIQGLSRSGVRALSTSWMQLQNDEGRADEMYRSVMEQIQRTGLPRSGYIVSLILWAMKNRSSGELLNEAVLLQNIIDYMLGRMDYRGALRSELDFTTKSSILHHVAMHFKNTKDRHEKNDVLQFVIALLDKKGLKYDAGALLDSFIRCGILYELGTEISFRYKRFQEFFVAGYLRENPTDLEKVKADETYFSYTRELDLFTGRWRHEKEFLELGRKQVQTQAAILSPPKLEGEGLETYLASGPASEFTQYQLNQMRKEPMTAAKIDALLDRTDRRVAEKKAIEDQQKDKTGVDKSNETIRYYVALELYSQFIRNLEFIDKEEKQKHLKECFLGWERVTRGLLSALAESIPDLKRDLPEDKTLNEKVPKEQLVKLVEYVESLMKSIMPNVIAEMAFRTLGSEKLVMFVDELIDQPDSSNLMKLLCTFVLLELAPDLGLVRLRKLSEANVDWLTSAITQRLYAYYVTRPLTGILKDQFENLVADLQVESRRGKPAMKGQLLANMKKFAFKEDKGT